ncbi:MAG: PEP/pyruvate-binding domain-containing protein [Anaerolineae bacterium]
MSTAQASQRYPKGFASTMTRSSAWSEQPVNATRNGSAPGDSAASPCYVLPLEQLTEEDAPRVGGKALRLAQLTQAGLPVLPGFCVTTAAYQAHLAASGIATQLPEGGAFPWEDAARLQACRTACAQAEMPPEVAQAIVAAYERLGSAMVAVRSSATFEDQAAASFAGQYDTFLNVCGADAVLERVRACWAGIWSERALAYMREQGIDPRHAQMGVLVQLQADATAAGVLFTLNPLGGNEEEMVIEAAWGLGEAVVSGRVTPERYVVNARRRQLVHRDSANQSVMLVADANGGTLEKPLAPHQQEQPVLSEAQVLELVELGCRVQMLYGYPQDIEWALVDGRFVLLQTRPLTSFSFDPALGQWTSGNYREVLPGFACPLALSLSLEHDYGRSLSQFFREIKLGEAPPGTVWGRPFFGRAYWNVGAAKQLAARLPGFKERLFDRTAGIDPTYEGDGMVTPWTPTTVLRALPVLFALGRMYKRVWREGRNYRDHFLNVVEPALDAVDPAALSDAELADYCRRVVELHWTANNVAIRVSLLSGQAQEEFEPMVRQLNFGLPPEQQIAEGDLITGLSDVRTAQPSFGLWQLAREGLADPEIAAAITQGDPLDMRARLEATPHGRRFWQRIEDYIRRYRYMASVDEDLIQPRWDEDPSFVLSTLQAYAQADESVDPARRLERQRQIRRATERRALKILSRGWRRLWWFGRRSFVNHLRLVRRYIWWREETRVVAARAFYHCRRFFKELGRRWAAAGILDDAQDIFLLRWPSIEAVLDGRRDAATLRTEIADYLCLKECYRNFEPPSVIGRGADVRPMPFFLIPPMQRVFVGIPCSSGVAEGPARVVASLEEARALRRGEILVARYTNPSWTPLFNLAAGIVIEEGGLLSHGAVVAREYGIPAVLRIERATRLFRTGQRLRVDGGRGIVEIV